MRYSILVLWVSCLITQVGKAQDQVQSAFVAPDTIPFELTQYNNISVQAIINESDTLSLMLHTAVNDASLTTTATAKISSVNFEKEMNVESWGGESGSRYSTNNQIQIGSVLLENLTLWESEHSGHLTDGKFGLNQLGAKITEFNMEEEYLVLHNSLPENIDQFHKLELETEDGVMYIKGNLSIEGKEYHNTFLIHSGFSGSLLLDDAFVEVNTIGEKLAATDESILKDSFGNELKTVNAILPAFELGDFEFQSLPVGFFEGSIKRQNISVLGGDVLKRFNIIFDIENEFIYLKSNDLMDSAYFSK